MITASRATELPQAPATIADEQIGLNGVIAVALTRSVGSMPALYAARSTAFGRRIASTRLPYIIKRPLAALLRIGT